MPTIVPPFVQYQTQLVPLRAIWNVTPKEGDRFTSAEIDWGVTTLSGTGNAPATAVQIDVGGNSPVAFSQIAALSVDNNRSAADVTFLFPDSAFELIIPAYSGGVFPVFTNALMFYVIAPQSTVGDVTTFQIFNSLPPPVAMLQSQAQAVTSLIGIQLDTIKTVQIIPASISGILEAFSIDIFGGGQGVLTSQGLTLLDGVGQGIWSSSFVSAPSTSILNEHIPISGLKVRFRQGITVTTNTGPPQAAGFAGNFNMYYSVP
jgi:hypothetical protein